MGSGRCPSASPVAHQVVREGALLRPSLAQERRESAAEACRGWAWAPGANQWSHLGGWPPFSQVHGFPAAVLGTLYVFTQINLTSPSWGRKCHHPHLTEKEVGSRDPCSQKGEASTYLPGDGELSEFHPVPSVQGALGA